MADSTILDHNGQPFKKSDLSKEVAHASLTGVRSVWNWGSEAEYITPERLGAILRAANDGDATAYLTLAEEMEERDPHYGSVLGTRKRAVSGLPVSVESATDDAADVKLADAVRELIRRPEFGDMLDDCLDALGKAYSVIEMNWDTKRTPWTPRDRNELIDGEWHEVEGYAWRDPRFFMYDRVQGRQLRLIDEEDTYNGKPLPPHRFIIHRPRLKSGLPIRGGLARLAAVAYMCKAYTVTDWMAFAEVFGMPLRVGKYGTGATPDDINTLINAVANIGTDAAAVIPESMRIEFEAAGNSTGGADLFKNLAEYLDKQISKAILGQTASADGTPGALGNSDSQDEVRQDILESDARQLSNTINKYLVRSFIDLNFGPQENYPRVVIAAEDQEDTSALVDNVMKLIPFGLKVEASVMRDKLGLPDPEDGAEVLAVAAAPTPPTPSEQPQPNQTALNQQQPCGCHACTQALHTARNREQFNASEQALDELEAASLNHWQAQIDPILQPIRDLLDAVDTAEEFAAGLQELLEDMDDTELVRNLAAAMFLANGVGDGSADA
jgi:phage gp29-like protein